MSQSFILFLATLGSLYLLCQAQAAEDCSVSLQNGHVMGYITGTANPEKNVCAYMAIPYARPPVGALRFQPPQPAAAWEGTLNATSQPNWCPQNDVPPEGIQVTEDCLYLNVYQPQNIDTAASLPVMIWFYGGSFTWGSFLPYTATKLLARGDVILVVVHYRLGLLGFLSTGDAEVPGNNGLKDQAFSIRWVNENIQAFSGNRSNILIFGESAGAASVMYQLLSPLNKGLIHGVIAQSGTPLSFWTIDRHPAESAKIMAERLNCPVDNGTSEMVSCLRQVPWQNIIQSQTEYISGRAQNLEYTHATVTPVVEPSNVEGAFISDDPLILLKTGDIPDIPVMFGANKHDGSYLLARMYMAYFGPRNLDKDAVYMKQQIVTDILKYIGEPETDPGNRVVASSIELAYLSGVNRSSWIESMPGLVDIITVFGYKAAAQNTAEILSARNRKVYLYSLEHHSENYLWPWFFGTPDIPVQPGISHADDLMYLFDFPANFSADDQSFSDLMCDMWLRFARIGNPTSHANEHEEIWTPYNSLNEPFLKLNLTPTVQYGYRDSWRPNGFQWDKNDSFQHSEINDALLLCSDKLLNLLVILLMTFLSNVYY